MEIDDTAAIKKEKKPGLRCLDDQPAPPDLAKAWRRYLELPPQLHAQIGQALAPVLLGLPQEVLQQHVSQLAGVHGIQGADLALALDACQALVGKATAHNLDAAAFDTDLKTLSGTDDTPSARAALVGEYDKAKQLVRQHLVRDSVADHGNVLSGLSWRVDRVLASSHGLGLDTTVLLMTLQYDDKGEKRHLTLQATDETLRHLRDFCDHMLQEGKQAVVQRE